jgi:hypothetical protein
MSKNTKRTGAERDILLCCSVQKVALRPRHALTGRLHLLAHPYLSFFVSFSTANFGGTLSGEISTGTGANEKRQDGKTKIGMRKCEKLMAYEYTRALVTTREGRMADADKLVVCIGTLCECVRLQRTLLAISWLYFIVTEVRTMRLDGMRFTHCGQAQRS